MIPKGPEALTLKQRLAALTQTPSSPSSPIETAPGSKRKFTAPWAKRSPSQNSCHDEFVREDRLQLIISKLIYQAGVDYECVHPNVTAPCVPDMFMAERVRCNAIFWKPKCSYSTLLPLMQGSSQCIGTSGSPGSQLRYPPLVCLIALKSMP
jgi:hypothetical protein